MISINKKYFFSKKRIKFLNQKEESLPFKLKFTDDASFEMTILQTLESRSEFTLKIDQKYFTDLAGNVSDSVHNEKISTKNNIIFFFFNMTLDYIFLDKLYFIFNFITQNIFRSDFSIFFCELCVYYAIFMVQFFICKSSLTKEKYPIIPVLS